MTIRSHPVQTCHVKGCGKQGANIQWFPDFGCCLTFCSDHAKTPEAERRNWIIELARAKREHDKAIESFN